MQHPRAHRRLSLVASSGVTLSAQTPTPSCLQHARQCGLVACRYHLGEPRALDGRTFRCALDVADSYPHGLAPQSVARLMGMSESEVQRIERSAAPLLRVALQRDANEEHERAVRARRQHGKAPYARPAAPTPRPSPPRQVPSVRPAPALVLTLCPGRVGAPSPRRRPRPRPRPIRAVDPRQMAFPWAA
jgi:hypothetical protein